MIAPEGLMPQRSTVNSAAYDFRAPEEYDFGDYWTKVNTQVRLTDDDKITVPDDNGWFTSSYLWALFIYPKSGLGVKYTFQFPNGTPIIDMDYRDDIILYIKTEKPCHIEKGQKFVQGVFQIVGILEKEIPPTEKRMGGFGSTGRF